MADPNNQSTSQNPVGRFMVAMGALIELNHTGKILITQRSHHLDWRPGEWEIPYGRIDQFEDVQSGLRREVREEVGIENIEIIKPLRVWHMFRGSEKAENEVIGITFQCRTNQEEITLSDESTAYRWADLEEALSLMKVEGIRQDIQEAMASRN